MSSSVDVLEIEPISVDSHTAAALTGFSVGTLINQRSQGIGPPYRKIKGKVLYLYSELKEYIENSPAGGLPVPSAIDNAVDRIVENWPTLSEAQKEAITAAVGGAV
ncbi:helix-turn-helix domain-containing protein [Actinomyces minihominis]|uniref:helix-turn-helix domain-containing protein n=1 Tax=Actinomyces minihominis TaxID=2002838 RepID=UPI000C08A8A4|nr:helix-turn-helix domain-containing protein [Actinomyces minihominis]